MGVSVAYGHKNDITSAIRQGKIPKECIIITNDSVENEEIFFYDYKGVLKSISGQRKFYTIADAENWAADNKSAGAVLSVYTDGFWNPYIVQDDGSLTCADEACDLLILNGGTSDG